MIYDFLSQSNIWVLTNVMSVICNDILTNIDIRAAQEGNWHWMNSFIILIDTLSLSVCTASWTCSREQPMFSFVFSSYCDSENVGFDFYLNYYCIFNS